MRIKKLLVGLCVATFALSGCEKIPKAQESQVVDISTAKVIESYPSRGSIKNTIGLVTPTPYEEGRTFRLYNLDGSLWLEFSVIDEPLGIVDFRPFAFDFEDGFLELKCVRQDETTFEVVVNEDLGFRKYIKKNDPSFQFESWESHILKYSGLDFDAILNPPRNRPNENATKIDFPEHTIFRPLKIQGDWVFGSLQEFAGTRVKGEGWIKWKVNDKVVIVWGIDEC